MKNSLRALASRTAVAALALGLATTASSGFAASFASTADTSAWTVSTIINDGGDGQFASFWDFDQQAAAARSGAPGWISNVASGTNGAIGDWTFFVFRQYFTLTAAEAATYDLKFQWAADDSGQGFAARGTWTPKFSLNGGALVDGSWATGDTYDYGNVTDVTGFHAGLNYMSFYVEGNGVTDGMALKTISFSSAVPEPGSLGLMAAGLGLLGVMARRRQRDAS